MENQAKTKGGKRENAGRKPSPDKKVQVSLYINKSIIDASGGIEELKRKLMLFTTSKYNFKNLNI